MTPMVRRQNGYEADYTLWITMIAKVLRWGNSYGIRISTEQVRRNGLYEGQEVVVEVKAKEGEKVDISWLKTFRGTGTLVKHHDEEEWA